MPKGGGNKKGKQPAKRPATKVPYPGLAGAEDPQGVAGQRAILEQIEALERTHDLPAGAPVGGATGKRDRVTRQASQQLFHTQICQCLMSVTAKAAATPGSGIGETPRLDITGLQDLVPRDLAPRMGGGLLPSSESFTIPQ